LGGVDGVGYPNFNFNFLNIKWLNHESSFFYKKDNFFFWQEKGQLFYFLKKYYNIFLLFSYNDIFSTTTFKWQKEGEEWKLLSLFNFFH
jgi:hypothetical protein